MRAPAEPPEGDAPTARDGSEARAAARGAAATTGAPPALRSVVLDLCARHGARQILWIGPGGEPLGQALRQAGYVVWGTDPSGNPPTVRTDRAPTPAAGATGLDPAAPPAGVRFDVVETALAAAVGIPRLRTGGDDRRPGGVLAPADGGLGRPAGPSTARVSGGDRARARRLPGTGGRPSPDRRSHRPNAGAERVDLQALLGHESVATTPMDTHVGQERMEQGVARL